MPLLPPVVVEVALLLPVVAAPSVLTDTDTEPVEPEAPLLPLVAAFETDTAPESPLLPE